MNYKYMQRNGIYMCSHLIWMLHWESEMKWKNKMGGQLLKH